MKWLKPIVTAIQKLETNEICSVYFGYELVDIQPIQLMVLSASLRLVKLGIPKMIKSQNFKIQNPSDKNSTTNWVDPKEMNREASAYLERGLLVMYIFHSYLAAEHR